MSLSVRIPLELYEELQLTADELAVDLSVVVRTALSIGAPRSRDAIQEAIALARADAISES